MRKNEDFRLPMSDEILTKYNFFELYPFDGGGNFIHYEIVKSIDDNQIAENILNGALNDFGNLPFLDFAKFERWRSIEKSCWLNRFYFLVPLAKYYRKTANEKIAAAVKDVMLHFIRKCRPPETPKEIKEHVEYVLGIKNNVYNKNTYEQKQRDETDVKYIWFDFQPASRIIHFLYALNYIKDSPSLTDAEFDEILESVRTHAWIIATSESRFEKLHSPGNHQSIRGLSLLYAGCVFKDDFFLSEGIRICKFHIENDYFADGVLKEISPSYHVFETWHVRDAFILAQTCNFVVSKHHESILKRAMDFVLAMRQPDGYSTVIDDGYALYLPPFLDSFSDLLVDVNSKNSKTSYYPDAQLAFYRDENQYICFDSSPNPGESSHYHAGKNAFTFFYKKQAFFIDGGCCSYDDPAFLEYKNAKSHSSLLVDGCGDGVFQGLYFCLDYTTPVCGGWQGDELSSTISSPVPQWTGITWARKLQVKNKGLLLNDFIRNSSCRNKNFRFIFNLHPKVQSQIISPNKITLKSGSQFLKMVFTTSQAIRIVKECGKCFIDRKHRPNTRINIEINSSRDFGLQSRIENVI